MSIRIGINGSGRISRLVFHANISRFDIEFVGINDPFMTSDYIAYMPCYGIMHGQFNGTIKYTDGAIIVNGKTAKFFTCMDSKGIPWGEVGAEYVVESTGMFLTREKAQARTDAGTKKVVMSTPSKDGTLIFVTDVNHEAYDSSMSFISNISRTTNCLAPIAKVLHGNWGVTGGLVTTVHPTTATQKTVDDPSKKGQRGGHAASDNIIPSFTGTAKAVDEVIPSFSGKLTGMSMRVPTPDVSVVDLTVNLARPAKYDEICTVMKKASEGELKDILGYTEDAVVFSDFLGGTHTSTFDITAGITLTDTFVKVVSWYDDETGYPDKVLDLVTHMYFVDRK